MDTCPAGPTHILTYVCRSLVSHPNLYKVACNEFHGENENVHMVECVGLSIKLLRILQGMEFLSFQVYLSFSVS